MRYNIWHKANLLISLLVFVFVGCDNSITNNDTQIDDHNLSIGFTKHQRIIADEIINVFEYSKVEIEYDHAEVVKGDEVHGITAGRLGFTSATGDMLDLIKNYYNKNPLSKYIPELERLHKLYAKNNYQTSDDPNGSMNVDGLDGLIEDWDITSNKKDFQDAQDKYLDNHYFLPALNIAKEYNLTLPLSLLCIYDAAIQNGVEGADALAKSVKLQKPTNTAQEIAWIKAFNAKRKSLLESKPQWRDTTYRISTLNGLIDQNKYHFDIQKITIKEWGNEEFDLVGSFNDPVKNAQLQIQKLDGSGVKDVDTDGCYHMSDNLIAFHTSQNTLKRCELRLSKGNEWSLSDDKDFAGQVQFSDIKKSGVKEFTFMQLHHNKGGKKPFIRLAWIDDGKAHKDANSGEKYTNGLWAIVRRDDKADHSKGANYYYFGSTIENKFISSEIKMIDHGKKVYLRIGTKDTIINVPQVWASREASDYYFKAGLYFSGRENSDRVARVKYDSLKMF